MNWLDYVVLGVFALSIGWGMWRGLVREVMALVGWVIAFLATNLFAAPLADALPASLSRPEYRSLVAFIAIFFVTLVICTLGAVWLAKLVHAAGLGSVDRVFGALFGLLRALILVLAVAIVAGFTGIPRSAAWRDSIAGAQLAAAATALKPWLPPALASRLKYN
ncbi:MAG TPA: CvpA family protein [Burkholderiales bacterium]|nr:CvpA family protein [Burkholderiales bacterium]